MLRTLTLKDIHLFLHSTNFREAKLKKGLVYFGSRKFEPLKDLYEELKAKGEKASCYGNVFYPERLGKWSYEENIAFWMAAMQLKRPFCLVTDIKHYKTAINKSTVEELFWLHDNGYKFIPDPINPCYTLAFPPENPIKVKINQYRFGVGPHSASKEVMTKKLCLIKETITNLRKNFKYHGLQAKLDNCDKLIKLAFENKGTALFNLTIDRYDALLSEEEDASNFINILIKKAYAYHTCRVLSETCLPQGLLVTKKIASILEDAYDLKYHLKDKQDAAILNKLGHALLLVGQVNRASKCFKQSLELDKNIITFNNLGSAYLALNRMDEASQMFYDAATSLTAEECTKENSSLITNIKEKLFIFKFDEEAHILENILQLIEKKNAKKANNLKLFTSKRPSSNPLQDRHKSLMPI